MISGAAITGKIQVADMAENRPDVNKQVQVPETEPGVSNVIGGAAELPAVIDRYRILRVLGEGGFGRVYLAHDDQLQRSVAIKVPHAHRLSGEKETGAFLSEARILANLEHPHIVAVHDVKIESDHLAFIVSKYVDGGSLSERIRDARLASTPAAELLATIAEALHHAHLKGVVHRDIKPGNILLDRGGKPHLADFGLALRAQDYGKPGVLSGTPAYMSPEQARGEGHLVDGRSDIFSLGVVMYELLAGKRPFRGPSLKETLDQIAHIDPCPPRQLDDAIPKELERICLKAIAKRPVDRYTTAKDMAADINQFLAGSQPKARHGRPKVQQSRRFTINAFLGGWGCSLSVVWMIGLLVSFTWWISGTVDPVRSLPATLLVDEAHEGTLAGLDPLDPETHRPSKTFSVSLVAGNTYLIQARSPEFGAYLRLETSDGRRLATGESMAPASKARLEYRASETALYRLVVTTNSPKVGTFDVEVQSVDPAKIPPGPLTPATSPP